mmetsp:Transcript_19192/g.40477  ORF Transcript_19192/g.40477 Transcript_19192/m.40477 type:complete len:114 (+) Transcript_19192:122-463(+)|eukprot:CAMPEP_0183728958 /NCGR_PEP_ID=MMETSP0737-20130205/29357_1 /TAXON_ID=385413 /ORGANISM="Thalassiosira miniscula, Strain CCMP1093" /LENGTH=113 /DNA_ID=CAMNT_0025961037 /DNA_START=91 /DNA_END=432 /DNA_ORIENTATION=+
MADGVFPRLNASLLHAGNWDQTIVSLVGKAVSFDGQETLEFECVDGGKIQVQVSPDFNFEPGKSIEIMGAAGEDKTVQHFISRALGEDFDADNYNRLVSKVLNNPKYADLFGV